MAHPYKGITDYLVKRRQVSAKNKEMPMKIRLNRKLQQRPAFQRLLKPRLVQEGTDAGISLIPKDAIKAV